MDPAENGKYILIADTDDEVLGTAPIVPPPEMPVPIHAKTFRDCQRLLSNQKTEFVGFFINPSLGHPAWVSIRKLAIANHPNCPAFLLSDKGAPLGPAELARLKISKVLQKPLTYDRLLAEIGIIYVPPKTALSAAAALPPRKDPGDELYVRVRTMTLLVQRPLQFDIYVKLSAGHFTRIWNADDIVDLDQLDRQAEKGVAAYYILKADQQRCLEACDEGIRRLIDDPSIPIEMKSEEVLAAGASTIDFLKRQGVTSESLVHAMNYAVAAQKIAAEFARHSDHLRKFLTDTAVQDHAISTAILGAFVVKNVKVPPGDALNKLNVAFMFHDIALWGQPQALQDEDEARMSPRELELFHAHPAAGAKILHDLGAFPSGILEAVEAHHMRLGKLGFPPRQGVSKISTFAELIGICSDFAHVISKATPEDQEDVFSQFLLKVRAGFSPSVVSGFERAFCSLA